MILNYLKTAFRNLIRNAPVALYEMDLSTDRFISVNDLMCDYLGYTREELLTAKVSGMIAGEDSSQRADERWEKMLSGRPVPNVAEYKVRRKDGREFWVLVNSQVHMGSDGRRSVIGIAYDITSRRHMEEELRRNLDELERFNKLAIGREIKMIKLKEEINGLYSQLNQDRKYKIVT